MNRSFVFILFILTVSFSVPVSAASPLVSVAWLKANMGKPGLVLLDTRGRTGFRDAHIPGSLTTEFGGKTGWRVNKGGVRGMLPDIPYLENLIGSLGIGDEDRVILIPGGFGAGEVAKAARIYWTLKVLGHDEVSILQGGLVAWTQSKNPLVKGNAVPERKVFNARFRPELLATTKDVETAIKTGVALIDSRSNDQFLGITKSGSIKRAGTLPGAKNVPGVWLTVNDGGVFRDTESLRRLYKLAGVKTDGPTIMFCNTGHWASIGWFVNSELLGNKETKLYDGSLAEWTLDPKRPVEKAF